jgi:tetratricopeptide (TPR) repeat protein
LCNQQRDHETARALYDESLEICRDLGDRSGIAWAMQGLGVTARHQGDHAAARRLSEESLAVFRDLGDREGIATALNQLGEIEMAQGDFRAARTRQEDSLARFKALGDRSGIAASLDALARIAVAAGEPERASRIWGAIERLREEIGTPRVPGDRQEYERAVAAARAAVDDDEAFDAAWQKGRAMKTAQIVDYALLRDVTASGGV